MLDERLADCSRLPLVESEGGVVLSVSCGGAVIESPALNDFARVGVFKRFKFSGSPATERPASTPVAFYLPSQVSSASPSAKTCPSCSSLCSDVVSEASEAASPVSSSWSMALL